MLIRCFLNNFKFIITQKRNINMVMVSMKVKNKTSVYKKDVPETKDDRPLSDQDFLYLTIIHPDDINTFPQTVKTRSGKRII